jgi:hypothetical protein
MDWADGSQEKKEICVWAPSIFFSNRLIGPMPVKKKMKKEADIKDPMRI